MSKVVSAAILFLGAGAALVLIPPAGRSHDPITTNITFNKEIVRILGRNCFGCHAENGVAQIPLTTYEQARRLTTKSRRAADSKIPNHSPSAGPRTGTSQLPTNDHAYIPSEVYFAPEMP